MPSSPDTLQVLLTRFSQVVKVMNHTGLICRARLIRSKCYSPDFPRLWRWWTTLDWYAELAWYAPSATHQIFPGCEGDEPHWTDMPSSPDTLQVLLTRFAQVVMVMNHTGLICRARLIHSKCYSPDLPKLWWYYLPTPPLGQDMTQGQFFKRSLTGLNSEFSFS